MPCSLSSDPTLEKSRPRRTMQLASPQISNLAEVPADILIEFPVRRIADPTCLLLDGAATGHRLEVSDLWAVPLDGEASDLYVPEARRSAWAEGYGGVGVGVNGGGGRVGLVDAVQYKGIGPTPLVGAGQPYFHAYGGASLEEAVLEVLWSRVIASALPHGAVPCYGVVLVGSMVDRKFPRRNQSKTSPRAMVARAPAWRWGHAMRSVWFRRSSSRADAEFDVRRTRAGVRGIARLGTEPLISLEDVACWLQLALARQARQVGTARAARLMHGSLTPSNVTWDGAWMDFAGGASTVSDFGPVVLPRGAPDFMNEERVLLDSLADFLFYLQKYLPAARGVGELSQPLRQGFSSEIQRSFEEGLLRLSGWDGGNSCDPNRSEAICTLRSLLQYTGSIPFTILQTDNDAPQTMPVRLGESRITDVWLAAMAAAVPDIIPSAVADELHCLACARSSVHTNAFRSLVKYWTHMSSGRTAREVAHAVYNSLRKCSPCHELYRTSLYPQIENAVDAWGKRPDAEVVDRWVADRVAFGRLHLATECDGEDWRALARSLASAPAHAVSQKLAFWVREHAAAK